MHRALFCDAMNNVVGAAMQAAGLSPGAIAGTMNGALAAAGMPALSPALTTGGVPANVVAESPVVLQKSMVLALFNVCGPQNPSHTREYVSLPLPTLHDLRSAVRCGRMHTALTARLPCAVQNDRRGRERRVYADWKRCAHVLTHLCAQEHARALPALTLR